MNLNECEVMRLFPTTVMITKLGLSDKEKQKIKKLIENEPDTGAGHRREVSNEVKMSKDIKLLNRKKYKFLRDKIFTYLDVYKNQIFKFEKTKFAVTNSWMSKSEPGDESVWHNHTGALFSCVYYVTAPENSGRITFSGFSTKIFQPHPKDPTVNTVDNSDIWNFTPEDDMVLFFPASAYHKIETNRSNKTRYSIACNFMPYGLCGQGDSVINIDNNFDVSKKRYDEEMK